MERIIILHIYIYIISLGNRKEFCCDAAATAPADRLLLADQAGLGLSLRIKHQV